MYIPKRFQGKGDQHAIQFIERFNFGVMVSVEGNRPIGTHLPFLVAESGGELTLIGHMAKANDQLKSLEGQSVLTIFSEPHAYISPKYYNQKQNVPTWNYMAVHVYGEVKILDSLEDKFRVLELSMAAFESDYLEQWKELDEAYKLRLANGMVAFEIRVTEMQHKEKLSQNRSADERNRIIDSFSKSEDANERMISEFMNDD